MSTTSTMNIIPMNLMFYKLPTAPKEDAIYWCIVKWTYEDGKIEYCYLYVGFETGAFDTGAKNLEVMAWCELENPELYFKEKTRIIVN